MRHPRDSTAGTWGLPQLDGYVVRRVIGARAKKPYQCPECGNDVAVGTSHVVVWPDELVEQRRHWHDYCWRLAARRGRAVW